MSEVMRKTDIEMCHYFRSDRFFLVDNNWYFNTRENVAFGPYKKLGKAQRELSHFLNYKSLLDASIAKMIS
ncbi:MAG: DUF6316 family protein [Pseudomonadota bacterium]